MFSEIRASKCALPYLTCRRCITAAFSRISTVVFTRELRRSWALTNKILSWALWAVRTIFLPPTFVSLATSTTAIDSLRMLVFVPWTGLPKIYISFGQSMMAAMDVSDKTRNKHGQKKHTRCPTSTANECFCSLCVRPPVDCGYMLKGADVLFCWIHATLAVLIVAACQNQSCKKKVIDSAKHEK